MIGEANLAILASRQLHNRPESRDDTNMSNQGSRPAAQRWGWALQYYYVDQVYLIPTKDDSADQTYSKHY